MDSSSDFPARLRRYPVEARDGGADLRHNHQLHSVVVGQLA